MIVRISGTVESFSGNTLSLTVSGLCYEVHIPTAVIKGLEGRLDKGSPLTLITFHYLQTDPSKSVPILIGFANRIEKEFFEKFITVSGVGPKAAVRALSQPIPDIAQAIDAGDLSFLKSLPGIGEQRAKEIIAKLQGKMGLFGLLPGGGADHRKGASTEPSGASLAEEAVEVLLQLQYKKDEAKRMVEKAFVRSPKMASVEEVLSEVYRHSKVPAR